MTTFIDLPMNIAMDLIICNIPRPMNWDSLAEIFRIVFALGKTYVEEFLERFGRNLHTIFRRYRKLMSGDFVVKQSPFAFERIMFLRVVKITAANAFLEKVKPQMKDGKVCVNGDTPVIPFTYPNSKNKTMRVQNLQELRGNATLTTYYNGNQSTFKRLFPNKKGWAKF